jgi:hypothetical protein
MHFFTSPIIFRVKQKNTNFMFCEAFLGLAHIIRVKTANYKHYVFCEAFFGLAHHLKQQNTNVRFRNAFFDVAHHHEG